MADKRPTTLYLTIPIGSGLQFGEDVTLKLVARRGGKIMFSIRAPADVAVKRLDHLGQIKTKQYKDLTPLSTALSIS